jgi:protein O-GlcNAc transferase
MYVLFGNPDEELVKLLIKRLEISHKELYNRVMFLPDQKVADYLNIVKLADVVLDTLYFGGVNTTYDAFAVGTPVITLPGQFSRGRYSYATYQKMGINDCIADSPADYIKRAVTIATNTNYRNEISKKIIEKSGILFEEQQAVSELSDLFEQLIYQSCKT